MTGLPLTSLTHQIDFLNEKRFENTGVWNDEDESFRKERVYKQTS